MDRAYSRPAAVLVEMFAIELREVEKVHRTGKLEYPALCGVGLTIQAGGMVAIVGSFRERQTVVGGGYSVLEP